MKTLSLIALALGGGTLAVAVPAAADVVHQTTFEHKGQSHSASYEPRATTTFKQANLGARGAVRCVWKTEVSVARTIVDANGRAIAALSRPLDVTRTAEGVIDGYCGNARAHQVAPFGGDRDKLRAFLAEAAERDAGSLRTELASLGALGRAAAR
jgi:hypothetical protein